MFCESRIEAQCFICLQDTRGWLTHINTGTLIKGRHYREDCLLFSPSPSLFLHTHTKQTHTTCTHVRCERTRTGHTCTRTSPFFCVFFCAYCTSCSHSKVATREPMCLCRLVVYVEPPKDALWLWFVCQVSAWRQKLHLTHYIPREFIVRGSHWCQSSFSVCVCVCVLGCLLITGVCVVPEKWTDVGGSKHLNNV